MSTVKALLFINAIAIRQSAFVLYPIQLRTPTSSHDAHHLDLSIINELIPVL